MVLLILVYCHAHLIQGAMTHLLGISQVSISANIDEIAPTVWACLPVPLDVYEHPTFPDGLPCGNEGNQGKFRRDHLRHYGDMAYIAIDKAPISVKVKY